jgi:hypothetical protein
MTAALRRQSCTFTASTKFVPCRFRAALVCKRFLQVLTCPELAGVLWAADLEFSGSVLALATLARLDSFVEWLQRGSRGLKSLKLTFTEAADAAEGIGGAPDEGLLREGIGSAGEFVYNMPLYASCGNLCSASCRLLCVLRNCYGAL